MLANVRLRRPPSEISFVRSSLGALGADRPRCHHCHRNPLVGERVHVFSGERIVCELCRPLHREAPERSELVHSPEHHRAVKGRVRLA